MSLTSMLKGKTKKCIVLQNIINIFDLDKNKVSITNKEDTMYVPYNIDNWKNASLVGIAFDYMVRFILKKYQNKLDNEITHQENYYIAEEGINILKYNASEDIYLKAKNIYDNALEIIDNYINGLDVNSELIINVSVYLAKLESIYRDSFYKSRNAIKNLFNKESKNIQNEILNLSNSFENKFINKFDMKLKKQEIYYNPRFGICSLAVEGADADIFMNDSIIDFKTTKSLDKIDKDLK